MEPFSVAGTCIALVGTITKVTTVLAGFIHDVRSARNELDAVSRELTSIKTYCSIVVVDTEKTLTKNDGTSLIKAARWATGGKEEIGKLRLNLEAHKCNLDITLNFWEL
ncbi:hypothetical protein HYALB_00004234 [Hymenoscyphus albidus]|uniref:Fungal N-terminal domain-containing protein n=1 Tax=Hymenoscyphus albidus TaxID=595503 RepID=A0A9N9LJH4_9HELO|nr:hypothetical protein HYALB_00004234 [Hymenoscyphus albidus]